MKKNKKRMTFLGIAIALTTILLVTPAVANFLSVASATANCAGYSLTVSAADLTPGTTYTINYTFTVTSNGTPKTFSGTITFTATASAATETASGTWSLTSSSTVTGSATLTSSGSTLPITINGSSSATLSCGVGHNSKYFVTYYSNNVTAAPDATVRIINDGDAGAFAAGDLWADFYVFDDSEELITCCSCKTTPDGLLSESVKKMTASAIRGVAPTRGVIKMISSSNPFYPVAGAGEPSPEIPVAGLRGWATHVQSTANKYPNGAAPYSQTETTLADSNLTAGEQSLLELLCWIDIQESGPACPCTPEDLDF